MRAIAVVVPARDEEGLLGRCLSAIAQAAATVGRVRVETIVVLDACVDGSARVAAGFDAHVLEVDVGNVGAARAIGVRRALELIGGGPAGVWIASTDADSAVPREWLRRHRRLADAGWDVVLGRVRPDPAELPHGVLPEDAAIAARSDEPVYGANLGVRASAYLAAGGYPPVPEHEDQLLVAALRRAGACVTTTLAAPVTTSARTTGRTPGGYAGFLRDALVGS